MTVQVVFQTLDLLENPYEVVQERVQADLHTYFLYIAALCDLVNTGKKAVQVPGMPEQRVILGISRQNRAMAALVTQGREAEKREEAAFVAALHYMGTKTDDIYRHGPYFGVAIRLM